MRRLFKSIPRPAQHAPFFGIMGVGTDRAHVRCERPVLKFQTLPLSSAELRATHEQRGGPSLESSGMNTETKSEVPSAGSRRTKVSQKISIDPRCDVKASCIEKSAVVAVDLATYWSNSVKQYALRGSPYLRPPVFASVWRLELEIDGTNIIQTNRMSDCIMSISAELKGAHERRLLEIHIRGSISSSTDLPNDVHNGIISFSGSVWCIATKADPSFERVVVPPVPLSSEGTEQAALRFKKLNQRCFHFPLVKPSDAEVSSDSSPHALHLTDLADDAAANQIGEIRGRLGKTCVDSNHHPAVAGACGDLGPLLKDAVCAVLSQATSNAVSKANLIIVEAEHLRPLAPNTQVKLRATSRDEETSLITGWVRGEPVLRMRVKCSKN